MTGPRPLWVTSLLIVVIVLISKLVDSQCLYMLPSKLSPCSPQKTEKTSEHAYLQSTSPCSLHVELLQRLEVCTHSSQHSGRKSYDVSISYLLKLSDNWFSPELTDLATLGNGNLLRTWPFSHLQIHFSVIPPETGQQRKQLSNLGLRWVWSQCYMHFCSNIASDILALSNHIPCIHTHF